MRGLALSSLRPRLRVSRTTKTSFFGNTRQLRAAASTNDDKLDGFTTLSECHVHEIEVKKSRFLAFAWRTNSPEEALCVMDNHKDMSASHNCFAWRISGTRVGGGKSTEASLNVRFNDDGEPGGTAGKPILAAIEGENMSDVTVMVTRYYGGTKLGTGGLVRAYGQAARDVLRSAAEAGKTTFIRPTSELRGKGGFDLIGRVYDEIESVGGSRIDGGGGEAYSADAVIISCAVTVDVLEDLKSSLVDVTAGRVAFVKKEEVEEEC